MHISDGEAFGAMLLAARRKMGLSHRQAAQEMGLSSSSLLQWEQGRLPMAATMISILKFYGITATIGYPPQPDPEPEVLT